MNRKNIATLFLIVCIVFINIEIKVQAEVIDGKIDWESATILTVYDEKIFFSIYDNITDKTVYFQYNVESDKCNKIGEIDNQEISSGDIAYNNDEIFFWVSKKKEMRQKLITVRYRMKCISQQEILFTLQMSS